MATLDRKAEGIPKPLWEAAKTLHKVECRHRGGKPGDGTWAKFNGLPEWAIRQYLKDAKKVVRAYREAEKKHALATFLEQADREHAEHIAHHNPNCYGTGDTACPGPDLCLTGWKGF